MRKAVVFDLDETLVDQRSAAAAAVVAWAAEYAVTTNETETALVERWHAVSTRHYRRYQAREVTFQEQRRLRTREFLAVEIDDVDADELFAVYLEHYEAGWRVFDDVPPALDRARGAGLRVAVLTNGEHSQQERKLERLGLTPYIDELVSSSNLPASKPDPRVFAAVIEAVDTLPEEALMVGDSLEGDVRGAQACGMAAVLLDRDGRHDAIDVVKIRTLADLDFTD